MSQLDLKDLKEGIFENSEIKLIKQLIDVLSSESTPTPTSHGLQRGDDERSSSRRKKSHSSSSGTHISTPTQQQQQQQQIIHHYHHNQTAASDLIRQRRLQQQQQQQQRLRATQKAAAAQPGQTQQQRTRNTTEDDEDIVVIDGEFDLDRQESRETTTDSSSSGDDDEVEDDDDEPEELYDDDDDVEYGQSRLPPRLPESNPSTAREHDEENSLEISILEKFKDVYQNEVGFSEHKLGKNFEKIFNLILNKRICSRTWLINCNSNKNLYFLLYCLRILLRDYNFQRQFLLVDEAFPSLSKLLYKYVNHYSSLHNQILLHSHILDQLLNVMTKIITSDALIDSNSNVNAGGRAGSGNVLCSGAGKKIIKSFFEFNLHVSLMQLIEVSNELCLVHACLNILIHLSTIDVENRPRLASDLDISDQLLLILQDYDEDSKRLASKLLCLLCSEEKIRIEVTNLDGVQVLLSLLHNHNNLEIMWNVIWSLVQLCSCEDNKREIRLMGGVPIILSILCDRNLDSQLADSQSSDSGINSQMNLLNINNNRVTSANNNDVESVEKRNKVRLQIQSACCALVTELAFNETNSYHIVNSNGVYLVASKLLISNNPVDQQSESSSSSSSSGGRNKDLERLHCNVLRALRLLFSAERHRSLIKKLIPFNMFEKFVDVGNFKKDLKLYQPLVDMLYKLTKEEVDTMRQQIKNCNQTQTPKNYINDYAVYEIIGSGGFGRVHKVKKKNSTNFLAMKEINTFSLSSFKDKSLGEIVNEVTIIRNNLKHPNIVRYLKTFKENESLYIVMELIDGTPLSQHFRTLKEKQEHWYEEKIWNLFIQIVLALRYLHKEKHIVHRDLTSNNIMLSENDKITITDFGLAKLKENDYSKMNSVVGTMFYSCPEIIKNEPYNEKADIWALGCLLYEMCCLEPPFCTPNMLALATKITQADYDHERLVRNSYSELIVQVVKSCLVVDPIKRLDIIGVAALIAEKILVYTDSIRYKSINLEKKLEKEKNKTQRFFCNRQDLNSYTSSSNPAVVGGGGTATSSTHSGASTSIIHHTSSVTSNLQAQSNSDIQTQSSTAGSPNVSHPSSAASSTTTATNRIHPPSSPSSVRTAVKNTPTPPSSLAYRPAANDTSLDSPDVATDLRRVSSPSQQSSAPNAKLPPIRHPKSKLIMKNLQNRQQQQQLQQQTSVSSVSSVDQIQSQLIMQSQQQQLQQQQQASTTSLNLDAAATPVNSTLTPNTPNTFVLGASDAPLAPTNSAVANLTSANNKIQRSSSSSILEKRSSQSKKSRPNSANAQVLPVYKKLRPIEDPIIQILEQIHKIMFIAHLPPSGKKNFKRKLVDRYKRSLFSNKRSAIQIKSELMKLIKNSNELIDIEMIGLKNFQYYLNSSGCNSSLSSRPPPPPPPSKSGQVSAAAAAAAVDSFGIDLEMIINQNGITYEQLQTIIEELLNENNYHIEHLIHLKEELPSID